MKIDDQWILCSPVDAVYASCTVSARIAVTLVDVHLAIRSGCPGSADALVPVYAILASPAELTWIALALVNLDLTELPGESWKAVAAEAVLSVDAGTAVAGVRLAVVDIRFAGGASESWRTLAGILRDGVLADPAVFTWR